MMYNKLVEECFFHPRHAGSINEAKPLVASIKTSQPNQIMNIELFIQCDESGLISKARFMTNGNPYVIASLEYLCRRIEGLFLSDAPELKYQDLVNELEIPNNQYPVALRVVDVYKEVIDVMKEKLED